MQAEEMSGAVRAPGGKPEPLALLEHGVQQDTYGIGS